MVCNCSRIYSESSWDVVYASWLGGDREALMELWGRIYIEVKRRVFNKLYHSNPDAADLAHEATVDAFVYIVERYLDRENVRQAFRSQEDAQHYMARVTWNWVLSFFKKPSNRRVFYLEGLELEVAEAVLSVSFDIDAQLEDARRMRTFNRIRFTVTRQWLKGLSAREVATRKLLRRMKGMSQADAYERVAEALGLTPEGVKTRIRHSRDRWERMMLARLQSAEIG